MTQTATEPGANVETTAPREMPSASVPVPDVSGGDDGGESYNPAQDTAAAFATLRAAAQSTETPAPETKTEVAAAAAEASLPEKPQTPGTPDEVDPTDAKLNRVFNRIAALERERDEARAYAARFESRAKTADELEAKFAKLKTDPRPLMAEAGWNQDTLADFILQGDRAVAPQLATVEQRQSALEAEVQQLRAEKLQAQEEKRLQDFVSTIPGQLGDHKSKFPTLSSYYEGSDAEMAQHVFNVMRSAYHDHKTELTILEAAQGIENVLANQAKRFARRASSETPTTPPAPPTKPAVTLTNRSTASPSPASEDTDDVTPNYQAALATMRARTSK